MRGSGDRIFGNSSGGREITRDEIAIVARRSYDHALGIKLRQHLKIRLDRCHISFACKDREIVASFKNFARLRTQTFSC